MYDWANSAFYTTVVGALFSPYLTRLAQAAVGENGVVLDLGPLGAVTAKSLPTSVRFDLGGRCRCFSCPILGALGDYSNLKKRLMALFCYIAVIANCLLFFVQGNLYLLGGVALHHRERLLWRVDRFLQRVSAGDHDRRSGRQSVEPRLCLRLSRRRDPAGLEFAARVAVRSSWESRRVWRCVCRFCRRVFGGAGLR